MELRSKRIKALSVGEPTGEMMVGDISGTIVSVFSSSLNIKLEERLLHITGEDKGIGPFSLTVANEDLMEILKSVCTGEKARFFVSSKSMLLGSSIQISMEESAVYKGKLEEGKFDKETVRKNTNKVLKYLFTCDKKEVGLDSDWLSKEQGSLMEYFISGKKQENSILDTWVGRGLGLTPSGDDILVGISAVFNRFGKSVWLENLNSYIIERVEERTTRISYEYLYYAAQGYYNNRICEFVKALNCSCQKSIIEYTDKLLSCGYTSGMDVLYGMLLALKKL